MTLRTQRSLTLVAVLGMAYWFFGNLYESIVFSPNWVTDSPAQFTRLNGFFGTTSPTLYFIPLTPLVLVLVGVLWWRNRDAELARDYRNASVAALALVAVTVYIVVSLVSRMFGGSALAHPADLHSVAWQWNAFNVVRMLLTAMTGWYLFRAFRRLDRRVP